MDRLTLTTEQQAFIDGYRSEHNVQPTDVVREGTNLVVDDHLQLDGSWYCVAVGPSSGVVDIYVPEWGIDYVFPCEIAPHVTDRAGPNGETMPIYDEQQMQAMVAKAGGANPQTAAKDERTRRRALHAALRDSLKRIPDEQQRNALRDAMRKAGALGKDDGDAA